MDGWQIASITVPIYSFALTQLENIIKPNHLPFANSIIDLFTVPVCNKLDRSTYLTVKCKQIDVRKIHSTEWQRLDPGQPLSINNGPRPWKPWWCLNRSLCVCVWVREVFLAMVFVCRFASEANVPGEFSNCGGLFGRFSHISRGYVLEAENKRSSCFVHWSSDRGDFFLKIFQ